MGGWLLLALLAGACRQATVFSSLPLETCQLSEPGGNTRIAAQCGRLSVPENRDAAGGRRIDLFVAVLRASGSAQNPDPVFLLAGGPGGAITHEYPQLAPVFARMNFKRDLVLVDQRGTGMSHPLDCPRARPDSDEGGTALEERLGACLAQLDADPRYYRTYDAIRDLDEVRARLGYSTINLYGGSYGTRVALAYARAFPDHTRSMILDGVVAFERPLGSSLAVDAQRALDRLFARCATDAGCLRAFPDLPGDLAALGRHLEVPARVVVSHPTTGESTTVHLSRRLAASTLRFLTYTSETSSLLPLLLHTAAAGELRPLAAQSLLLDEALAFSEGMHYSVICSEDFPYIGSVDERGSYIGGWVGDQYRHGCAVWPRGDLPAGFETPVRSEVPALLLSGELDPVTPPASAETALRTLSRARHIVMEGEAHGILHRACVAQIVSAFLETGDPSKADMTCLAGHRPLPFFTSFKGPEQ